MNVEVQKAARNNAQEVSSFLQDLSSWTQDMKAQELADNIPIEEVEKSSTSMVTEHKPKTTTKRTAPEKIDSQKGTASTAAAAAAKKRSDGPWDYSAWEKYDAERACLEIDKTKKDEDLTEDQLVKKKALLIRLKKVANTKKDLGNECLKDKNYVKAIDFYTEGIKLDPSNAILFANRAQAYLYTGENTKAREDCDKALALDSTYVKAVFRRAKAFVAMGDTEAAKTDLKRTLSLDAKNPEAIRILNGLMATKRTVKKSSGSSPPMPSTSRPVEKPDPISALLSDRPLSTSPTNTFDFSSEMKERTVTRFKKPEGGGGDSANNIFPRFIKPIQKSIRPKSAPIRPLVKIPVKIVGEPGRSVKEKPLKIE